MSKSQVISLLGKTITPQGRTTRPSKLHQALWKEVQAKNKVRDHDVGERAS